MNCYLLRTGFVLVRAKPLDSVLKELGVNGIDCVKVDVEGAELEVLKGMRRTLRRFRPIVVAEVKSENLRGLKASCPKSGMLWNK